MDSTPGAREHVSVEFGWREIGGLYLDARGSLLFPPLDRQPGVYRFRFTGLGHKSVYVGESVNLVQRASLYRFPAGRPSLERMNDRLVSHLREGGSVLMSLCTDARLRSGGAWSTLDLRFRSARLLIENAALWPLVLARDAAIENLPGVGDLVGVDGSPWPAPSAVELDRRLRAKARTRPSGSPAEGGVPDGD